MSKIDRPFVPGQPGAGTDNYIDGGPTRAGLEELRGKVNAAPVTWATVAEAEAASYTEPESVVITENGRIYTYSASSVATRDGIRVLAPAGGGRLLALNHGGLNGLTDDGHTQYALLAGRSGGQTINGSTVESENLTLSSTANATKGKIFFGANSVYDEVNDRLGIGTTTPISKLSLTGIGVSNGLNLNGTATINTIDANSIGFNFDGTNRWIMSISAFYTYTGFGPGLVGTSNVSVRPHYADATVGLSYGGLGVLGLRAGSSTADAMTLNNGNVGIGHTSPTAKLQVKGSTSDSSSYEIKLDNNSNDKNFYVRNDGQIDSSGSRVIGYEEFTSDSTLTQSSKSSVVCNPSGTGMVLTMHLSPPDGILQTIVNASAFGITLGRNGQKIAGLESNYTLPANTSITLQFFGATLGWLIISNG